MDQKQPLEVIGNDLVSIQMIPGQKEQKLSKKAKNSQLAITLSSSSEMNSFFVTNDNFCMQKQWPVQKNKLNFFAQKKLDFLVPLLLKLATLNLALQFLLKQCLFLSCVCLI